MQFRIFYMRPDYFRQFIAGDVSPTIDKLSETHAELRTIDAESIDDVYSEQQAENWAVDWETCNALLRSKGLGHTSMSIGDVAENVETGEFYAVAFFGWTPLGKR